MNKIVEVEGAERPKMPYRGESININETLRPHDSALASRPGRARQDIRAQSFGRTDKRAGERPGSTAAGRR
jgi:hypothetical protein